jgi:hypothetical protein
MSVYSEYRPLNLSPVTVPSDFCGIAMHSYPSGADYGPYNPPTLVKYKTTYNNDWRCQPNGPSAQSCNWFDIETSAGVYNWTPLDTWAAGHAANGATLCYSNVCMPSFYSVNAATQYTPATGGGGPFFGIMGPLSTGGGTPGAGVGGGLYNFVFNAIRRCIARGNPLKYWQVWSEPDTAGTTHVSTGVSTWWGTPGQMVDLAYWSYLAAKAADPNIMVLAPAPLDSSGNPSASWFFSTAGTQTGVFGYQTCDEFGFDIFDVGPPNFQWGIDTANPVRKLKQPTDISYWISQLTSQMGGNVKPISITSLGLTAGVNYPTNPMQSYVFSQTPLWRKQWMARTMLACAAMGVKRVILWNYDHYVWTSNNLAYYFTDFVNDGTGGVTAGFNDIANNVAGKTITFCGVRGDGKMFASFSDGSSYVV